MSFMSLARLFQIRGANQGISFLHRKCTLSRRQRIIPSKVFHFSHAKVLGNQTKQ